MDMILNIDFSPRWASLRSKPINLDAKCERRYDSLATIVSKFAYIAEQRTQRAENQHMEKTDWVVEWT